MKVAQVICFIIWLAAIPFSGHAQKVLVEGTVVYKAVLKKPDGSKQEGSYTIAMKNKQVRKDLKIGSEFENVVIVDDANKGYTLRSVADKNFAVEMTGDDFARRNQKYQGAVVKEQNGTKTIAGMEAQKATVTYRDGSSEEVYFTRKWKPELTIAFERFGELEGFPLAFEYRNEQGAVISFEAVTLNEDVVENAKFKVPPGYQVISSDEYRKLRAK